MRSHPDDADPTSELVADQIDYYRARAAEYDASLRDLARYYTLGGNVAGGDEAGDIAMIEQELLRLAPFGRVLELACGTGWWTQLLAANGASVTAVDASPEMLAINRERVARPNVRYVAADIFNWRPSEPYDLVFFAFWLSHVPHARLEAFWRVVQQSLAPGGRVYFIDELEGRAPEEDRIDDDAVRRTLHDGRNFRAVKVFYRPPQIAASLKAMGWRATVSAAGRFFYGTAMDAPP